MAAASSTSPASPSARSSATPCCRARPDRRRRRRAGPRLLGRARQRLLAGPPGAARAGPEPGRPLPLAPRARRSATRCWRRPASTSQPASPPSPPAASRRWRTSPAAAWSRTRRACWATARSCASTPAPGALPPVFAWLARAGRLDALELLRTFNCGIGMIARGRPDARRRGALALAGRGRDGAHASATVAAAAGRRAGRVQPGSRQHGPPPRRRPDLGRRLEPAGADRRTAPAGNRGRDRARGQQPAGRARAGRARGEPASPAASSITAIRRAARRSRRRSTRRCDARGIELVCLAGFMRILTAGFVERWRDRLLNIHPSLLPAFPGLHTHARALAAGVQRPWLHRPSGPRRGRRGPDPGPGRRPGAGRRRRGRPSPPACWRSSTAATRWRWSCSPPVR